MVPFSHRKQGIQVYVASIRIVTFWIWYLTCMALKCAQLPVSMGANAAMEGGWQQPAMRTQKLLLEVGACMNGQDRRHEMVLKYSKLGVSALSVCRCDRVRISRPIWLSNSYLPGDYKLWQWNIGCVSTRIEDWRTRYALTTGLACYWASLSRDYPLLRDNMEILNVRSCNIANY